MLALTLAFRCLTCHLLVTAATCADAARSSTYADPGDGDLRDLPPTLVVVCEFDTLRPTGEVLARDLQEAGTTASLVTAAGAPHGHLNIVNPPSALATIADLAEFLNDPARELPATAGAS